MSLFGRFKNWWNAFSSRDPTRRFLGFGSSFRNGRNRLSVSNIRSVVAAAYNRIAVDVASVDFRHVRLNDEGKYKEDIDSYLNDCLKINANLDQSSQALFIDIVESLIDEGCVALVPTDTNNDPLETDNYDVGSIRVGKILEWYPLEVKVELYREETGMMEQIVLPKRILPIIENPFYTTMNEPNSTLRRLVRVLNQLDAANDLASSNKLNMLIQLPYTIKSDMKKRQIEKRLGEIQDQLTSSD
ncbi:MAG: phage portal protein, partial [Prevotella sp.]|nr:phage portal protein [Prevotella sp.]